MHRIDTFAGELREKDILRDAGARRTIAKIEQLPGAVAEVLVHFQDDPTVPGAPAQLQMAAAQPVTAWRAT